MPFCAPLFVLGLLCTCNKEKQNTLMTQVSWGHYLNIHKHFVDKCKSGLPLDDIFQEPVCVTEKLDGSNLGIHVARSVDGLPRFHIVALMGRNSILWSPTQDDCLLHAKKGTAVVVPNTKYGNAGALEALPAAMLSFATAVADALHVDDIIIYGEAYRADGQKKASWHPFGYKVRLVQSASGADDDEALAADGCSDAEHSDEDEGSSGWTKFGLTAAVHQMFSTHQNVPPFPVAPLSDGSAITSRNAFQAALVDASQNGHVVCPPLLLFSGGTLGQAIDALAPMLMSPIARSFEGAFVVCEGKRAGFKWKTGLHDEQKGIPSADELVDMGEQGFDAKAALVAAHVDGSDASVNRKAQWLGASLPLGYGFRDPESTRLYSLLYDVFRARPQYAPEPAKKKSSSDAAPAAAVAKKSSPADADVAV